MNPRQSRAGRRCGESLRRTYQPTESPQDSGRFKAGRDEGRGHPGLVGRAYNHDEVTDTGQQSCFCDTEGAFPRAAARVGATRGEERSSRSVASDPWGRHETESLRFKDGLQPAVNAHFNYQIAHMRCYGFRRYRQLASHGIRTETFCQEL